jgi:hypothetical protein
MLKTGGRESRQWGHHAAQATEPSRTAARTSPTMAWRAMTVGVCHGLKGFAARGRVGCHQGGPIGGAGTHYR